jgi:hypothetical protein
MANQRLIRGLLMAAVMAAPLLQPGEAAAQIDPLLFLKDLPPNVLLVVDTSARMRLDADGAYYDPAEYTFVNQAWEVTIGVTSGMTKYRRRYDSFVNIGLTTLTPNFRMTNIGVTGNNSSKYAYFDAKSRLSLARAALTKVVTENTAVARFGLIKTRQSSPSVPTSPNASATTLGAQQTPTETNIDGKWLVTTASVTTANGLQAVAPAGTIVQKADAASANANIVTALSKAPDAGGLIPVGAETAATIDSPVDYMLQDAKSEAQRIIAADCRNTIVVLVTGGGEGNTAMLANPTSTASQFLNIGGQRVPIYVVAIAPPAADQAQLQTIATNSGGKYFEITKAMIDAAYTSWDAGTASYLAGAPAGTIVVPEMVRAMNLAVQHAFQRYAQFSTGAAASEFQVTSPIIGTVELADAKDINGAALTNTVVNDKAGVLIPQRSNLMVTTGFSLPGFDGKLRGFRVHKPIADSSASSGYRFVADGTPLWVATTPAADSRNLFTVLPDGTMVAFSTTNAAALAAHMNMSATDASALISFFRALPLGAPVDSTPAILNPPSLDPPPDAEYMGYAAQNKDRRSLVFVGTNRGILEAIDGRLGVEVWGFIPYNLLPKLKTLLDDQSVGSFDFFVDSSPKLADVKVADEWKTYLFFGQGPGGTFYQTLDVTLSGLGSSVSPKDDNIANVLAYFASPTRIPLKWSFPRYSNFDPTMSTTLMPYGDLKPSASTVELTVGQTWSDPSVGQIQSPASPYVLLVGSGFLPKTVQAQANRGNTVAGSTFYMLNVADGSVIASKDVGNDNKAETVDNCVTAGDCSKMKNALQSDPVASGPQGSRFISDVYIGDLDGRIWRLDMSLGASDIPEFLSTPVKIYDDTASQPIFNSMAVIDVGGGTQRYLFAGTGSDLLPSTGVSMQYKLVGVLDSGTSGSVAFSRLLAKVDGSGDEEKVTAYPAVAGDVVFFTTTTTKAGLVCALPDAKLYALTFVGGAAYDNTGDNKVSASDTPVVKTITGVRATAPFVVDQHLVFGAGESLQMFGDPQDFNNGVGQAGVRILSWREVR